MMLTAARMRSLPAFFQNIDDPRRRQGRRHALPTVLALAAAATLCGMRGYKAISEWVENLGLEGWGRRPAPTDGSSSCPRCQVKSQSGLGGVLGGTSMNAPGPNSTPKSALGVKVSLMPLTPDETEVTDGEVVTPQFTESMLDEELKKREEEQRRNEEESFKGAENTLREAIEENPKLRKFNRNLLIDTTPEGIRIQIVDGEQRSMFASGSRVLYAEAKGSI